MQQSLYSKYSSWDSVKPGKPLQLADLAVLAFDCSPNGECISVAFLDNIKTLHAKSGRYIGTELVKPLGEIRDMKYSRCGQFLCLLQQCNYQIHFYIWDMKTRQLIRCLGLDRYTQTFTYELHSEVINQMIMHPRMSEINIEQNQLQDFTIIKGVNIDEHSVLHVWLGLDNYHSKYIKYLPSGNQIISNYSMQPLNPSPLIKCQQSQLCIWRTGRFYYDKYQLKYKPQTFQIFLYGMVLISVNNPQRTIYYLFQGRKNKLIRRFQPQHGVSIEALSSNGMFAVIGRFSTSNQYSSPPTQAILINWATLQTQTIPVPKWQGPQSLDQKQLQNLFLKIQISPNGQCIVIWKSDGYLQIQKLQNL